MIWLFAGAVTAVFLLMLLRWAAEANVASIRRMLLVLGLSASLVVAFILIVTGRAIVAWPFVLAAAGLYLRLRQALGLWSSLSGLFGRRRSSSGKTSTVATSHLCMTLNHDSGTIAGEILDGVFKGRQLADLGHLELIEKLRELRRADGDGARLLESYLDRCWPEWRTAGGQNDEQASPSATAMTEAEAREILGVGSDAGATEIRAAHRRLMQKLHPDHGGSDYLAAKINQAKEVLLAKRG